MAVLKRHKKILNLYRSIHPDLFLVPGDFSYKKTGDCFLELINPIKNITKIAIGNHDGGEEESLELKSQYMTAFNLSKSYYSFNIGNAHFIMMNTQFDASNQDQYNFVLNDLKNNYLKHDWTFVLFHKPFYISETKHPSELEYRNIYHPLFDQYGVDVVFQAHSHNYERTFPIEYNKNSDIPIIKNNTQFASLNSTNSQSNEYFTNPEFPIFVTVGTGGRSIHEFKDKQPFSIFQFDKGYGILKVELQEKMLNATYYTQKGSINDDQFQVTDQFKITK